jgi:hypothetical protein
VPQRNFIARSLGIGDTDGIDWVKLLIEVGVAAVVVLIYGGMAGRKTV